MKTSRNLKKREKEGERKEEESLRGGRGGGGGEGWCNAQATILTTKKLLKF
jgi:hypothetical protein